MRPDLIQQYILMFFDAGTRWAKLVAASNIASGMYQAKNIPLDQIPALAHASVTVLAAHILDEDVPSQ